MIRAFFRINEYINIANPVRALARGRELRSNKTEICFNPIKLTAILLTSVAPLLPAYAQSEAPQAVKTTQELQLTADMIIADCPIDGLRKAYQSLVNEQETFNLSAAEQQMLLVCTERQQLVKTYIQGVKDITKLLGEIPRLEKQTAQLTPRETSDGLEVALQTVLPEEQEIVKTAPAEEHVPMSDLPSGVYTGTNGCSVRYSLIGTGAKGRRPYAIIADELGGHSRDVFIGEEMPFGVKLKSIRNLNVVVEDQAGESHVLPFSSADWETSKSTASGTDGLIWHKLDAEQSTDGKTLKRTPTDISVFQGYSVD